MSIYVEELKTVRKHLKATLAWTTTEKHRRVVERNIREIEERIAELEKRQE